MFYPYMYINVLLNVCACGSFALGVKISSSNLLISYALYIPNEI